MQDIHAIGGGGAGAGRLFTAAAGGGGGSVDRRLRPHNHHHNHQPLKCPRCDSLNTKFCYYNNYNLSQPRHFCKNCRRYWTKGGVLRNVPVGGGCRKSKRSKPKSSGSSKTAADGAVQREQKSNSHSSNESSSLTAATTTATASTTAGATVEVASATNRPDLVSFAEDSSGFFMPQNGTNPSFDDQPLIDDSHALDGQIFSEIANFTSPIGGFNTMGDVSAYRLQQNERASAVHDQSPSEQWRNDDQHNVVGPTTNINSTGYLDQIDLTAALQQSSRGSNGGLAALDWQNPKEGMFDFTGVVDQAYWSQTQWHDPDQSLNFLP